MVLKNQNEYELGKTTVLFVRHGERIRIEGEKNVGLRIPGPGLTDNGKKQAIEIAKKLKKLSDQVDNLYCSNMSRAIETAQEIGKTINKKPIIIPELAEFNKSLWDLRIFTKTFWISFSRYRKSLKVFNKILKKNKGKFIILVVHGNIIKGFTLRKIGISFKKVRQFHHDYCSISSARFSGTKLDHINCINSNDFLR